MAIRVGINGFGRIGRNVFRASLNEPKLEFVAINDITDAKTLAHLLRYDSVHGQLGADIIAEDNALIANGKRIEIIRSVIQVSCPGGILVSTLLLNQPACSPHVSRLHCISRPAPKRSLFLHPLKILTLRSAMVSTIRITTPSHIISSRMHRVRQIVSPPWPKSCTNLLASRMA